MDAMPKTRWYQVTLGRFLLAVMLLSAAGGALMLDPQHNPSLALVLAITAVGAWFGHPFWGAFAGFAVSAILAILILLAISAGLIPIAG